jgi:hypothetical protein
MFFFGLSLSISCVHEPFFFWNKLNYLKKKRQNSNIILEKARHRFDTMIKYMRIYEDESKEGKKQRKRKRGNTRN